MFIVILWVNQLAQLYATFHIERLIKYEPHMFYYTNLNPAEMVIDKPLALPASLGDTELLT